MDADSLTSIRGRYGRALPSSYLTVQKAGHFSTSPWSNYLELQDCEWLSLDEIAAYEFLSFQITSDGGYIPFATSARRDEFCWRLDWAMDESEPPVVFCERGEGGLGYAPNFAGFLYRKTLEEFGGAGPENERGLARLRRAVEIVTAYLPRDWADRLRGLAARDFAEWQTSGTGAKYLLAPDGLDSLVRSQLAFPHLNEPFVQDKELLRRQRR